jgi:hypothetical protein
VVVLKIWNISVESLVLTTVCLADMLSTMYFVAAGMAVEQNPIMAYFMNKGMPVFAAAKLLSFIPFIIAVEIYRRRNPEIAIKAVRFAIAAYVIVFVVCTLATNTKF